MSITELGQHAPHPFFGVSDDDRLTISGRSLVDVAAQAGRTPFYIYSRQYITERVSQLRLVLPPEVRLHYSIKANPMPAVVNHLAELVDGLDVASAQEMQIALDAGMDPIDVSFTGPGKQTAELARAVAAGVVIDVESEVEVMRLTNIARSTGKRPAVAVRVNPDFELRSSGMRMSGGSRPFGVDAENVPKLLAQIAYAPLEFVGFHIFCGSQNLSAEAIIEAQHKCVALATNLSQSAPSPVRLVNIGGGFGIPYFPGDKPLDIQVIGTALSQLADRCRTQGVELAIELGRYLVGEAGLYVCQVIDRKVSRGKIFLITDGGLHHHLAATGNFGQIVRKNYPILIGNRVRGSEREIVSIVGPLCTPLDVLAEKAEMAKAAVGDFVVVLQSGAYGLTASPSSFLSHPPPAEFLV
jgi:diaminopimelate decarboxylase